MIEVSMVIVGLAILSLAYKALIFVIRLVFYCPDPENLEEEFKALELERRRIAAEKIADR